MLKIKKIVLLQNISMALGVLAFCLSVFSLYSISSINEKMNDFKDSGFNSKSFKPIKDIPDVEIVNNDGSVVKVHAKESNDELSKIIGGKREKSNNIKKNTNDKAGGGDAKDGKKQKSSSGNKNGKQVVPVSRSSVSINVKQQQTQQLAQNKHANNNVVGDFVVQIGAFKDKAVAERQCQKARSSLRGKRCGVVVVNEQTFRAVVYPFVTNEDAVAFANRLTNALGSQCFAKKNG